MNGRGGRLQRGGGFRLPFLSADVDLRPWALALPLAFFARSLAAAPEPPTVESVSVQSGGGSSRVVVQSDKRLAYSDEAQSSPAGVLLRFSPPALSRRPPLQNVDDALVQEIRFQYKGGKAPSGGGALPLESIFIKLKRPASHSVVQKDWLLAVELKGAAAAPRGSTEIYRPAAPLSRKRGESNAMLPPRPTLEDFLQVGLKNHVPLRLAEQEYSIARLRLLEASRAFLPSVTGRYVESEGTLLLDPSKADDDTDFRRKEYGVQLGQPLFRSGGLYYSLRQAALQKRMAAENVRKARDDAVLEIKRTYYNLLKARRSVKRRRELLGDSQKILELTRRKRQLEVSTEVEALGVESQHNQIHYRALSEEKDLELAKLKAAALLNIPEDLPEDMPDPDENFSPDSAARLETDVSALLDQAASHRPELIAAAHAARFHSYGYKAARAEGRLHVDASGFVGRGGGAFASEPLELRHSWNAGVQAKLYFIGNSVKGNASRDRTSPDLGETSRTDTDARSAEIGFLDGFKRIADKRQSRVARDRAAMEYDQTRRQVEVDVREAYYNMEKALIQLKAERLNVEFRRKEATIARQKERLNLVEPSQRLAAEGLYTDAQVAFDEAVAFYRVAIASLEKAVGVPAESLLK